MGGMAGRFAAGILTDLLSWRWALGAIGLCGVAAALLFWRALPPSLHFHPRPLAWASAWASFLDHLRDAGLPWIFAEGFLLLGSFTTVYNYIGYRLVGPPYGLSQTAAGAIFSVYLVGIGSSAWVGDLAGRLGRRRVLWATMMVMMAGLAVTLASPLAAVIAGLVIFTFGFFGAHSVASSWVGARARHARGQGAALYLFFYYMGSSVMGLVGGLFWTAIGWRGVVLFVDAVLILGLLISLRIAVLRPTEGDLAAAVETLAG